MLITTFSEAHGSSSISTIRFLFSLSFLSVLQSLETSGGRVATGRDARVITILPDSAPGYHWLISSIRRPKVPSKPPSSSLGSHFRGSLFWSTRRTLWAPLILLSGVNKGKKWGKSLDSLLCLIYLHLTSYLSSPLHVLERWTVAVIQGLEPNAPRSDRIFADDTYPDAKQVLPNHSFCSSVAHVYLC